MLCQISLLSTPSICQLIWLARVPFSDPYPPAPEFEKPGVSVANCVKSRPFSGALSTATESIIVVCVVVVVSSVYASASTSTVSADELTVSFTGCVKICPAETVTPSTFSVLNPVDETTMSYLPRFNSGNAYSPADVDVVVSETLVATLVICTVAPGITAPD